MILLESRSVSMFKAIIIFFRANIYFCLFFVEKANTSIERIDFVVAG